VAKGYVRGKRSGDVCITSCHPVTSIWAVASLGDGSGGGGPPRVTPSRG